MEVMEILDGVFTIVRRIARSQLKLRKSQEPPAPAPTSTPEH
jgi:hypothetical protein